MNNNNNDVTSRINKFKKDYLETIDLGTKTILKAYKLDDLSQYQKIKSSESDWTWSWDMLSSFTMEVILRKYSDDINHINQQWHEILNLSERFPKPFTTFFLFGMVFGIGFCLKNGLVFLPPDQEE